MVSGGGLQALPQAWSAISKVQSALGADTERIQSGGELSDTGSERKVQRLFMKWNSPRMKSV